MSRYTRYLVFRRAGGEAQNPRGDGELYEHLCGRLEGHGGYVDALDAQEALVRAAACRGEGIRPGDEFEVYPVVGSVAFVVDGGLRVVREDPQERSSASVGSPESGSDAHG